MDSFSTWRVKRLVRTLNGSNIELDNRKGDVSQVQAMLYQLLDHPPESFLEMTKTQEYLVVQNTAFSKQISDFLSNIVYPPVEHSAFVGVGGKVLL